MKVNTDTYAQPQLIVPRDALARRRLARAARPSSPVYYYQSTFLTTLANAVAHNDASRRRPASAASATRRARGRSRARALERSTDRSPSSARPFARAPTDRPRVESTGRRASPPAARRASRRRPSRVDRARRPRASLRFRITRKTFRLPRADARHRPRVRHKTPHFRARELQCARSASRPVGRAASRAGRDARDRRSPVTKTYASGRCDQDVPPTLYTIGHDLTCCVSGLSAAGCATRAPTARNGAALITMDGATCTNSSSPSPPASSSTGAVSLAVSLAVAAALTLAA